MSALLKGLFKKICFSLRWQSLSHLIMKRNLTKCSMTFEHIIKDFWFTNTEDLISPLFVISGHPGAEDCKDYIYFLLAPVNSTSRSRINRENISLFSRSQFKWKIWRSALTLRVTLWHCDIANLIYFRDSFFFFVIRSYILCN